MSRFGWISCARALRRSHDACVAAARVLAARSRASEKRPSARGRRERVRDADTSDRDAAQGRRGVARFGARRCARAAAFGRLDAAEHRARVDVASFLGKVTQLQGRYRDAEAHFRTALASSTRAGAADDDAAQQFVLRTHVASAEERQGKHDDAEANYAAALEGLARHSGWSNGRTYPHRLQPRGAAARPRAPRRRRGAPATRRPRRARRRARRGRHARPAQSVTLAEAILDQPDSRGRRPRDPRRASSTSFVPATPRTDGTMDVHEKPPQRR